MTEEVKKQLLEWLEQVEDSFLDDKDDDISFRGGYMQYMSETGSGGHWDSVA